MWDEDSLDLAIPHSEQPSLIVFYMVLATCWLYFIPLRTLHNSHSGHFVPLTVDQGLQDSRCSAF